MRFSYLIAILFLLDFLAYQVPVLAADPVIPVHIRLKVPSNRSPEEILRLRGYGWEESDIMLTNLAYVGNLVLKSEGRMYLRLDNLHRFDTIGETPTEKVDLSHLAPPGGRVEIPPSIARKIHLLRDAGEGTLWNTHPYVQKFISLNSLKLALQLEPTGIAFKDASVGFISGFNDFRFPVYLQTHEPETSLSSYDLTPFSTPELSKQRFGVPFGDVKSSVQVIYSDSAARIIETEEGSKRGFLIPHRNLVGVKILPLTQDVSLALFGVSSELLERRNTTEEQIVLVPVRNYDLHIAKNLEEYELWSTRPIDTTGHKNFVEGKLKIHGGNDAVTATPDGVKYLPDTVRVTPFSTTIAPGSRDSRLLEEIVKSSMPDSVMSEIEQLQKQSDSNLRAKAQSWHKRSDVHSKGAGLGALVKRACDYLLGLLR